MNGQNNFWYSSKIYSMKPKLDIGLFVDLAEFTCFYQFLHDVNEKIVRQIKTKQFNDHIMQELVKTGKFS